jgi:hypothetical protein
MTETKINVEKMRKVLEFISANPERHEQSSWTHVQLADIDTCENVVVDLYNDDVEVYPIQREEAVWSCGTTGCFAGWTAMFEGWRPIAGLNGTVYRDDRIDTVSQITRNALGLSLDESMMLFQGGNTRQDLWYYANRFTNGEIKVPEEFRD